MPGGRVDQELAQRRTLSRGQVRDGSVEVGLVLGAGVLGLEQQDQLGSQVRDAVWGVVDDLAVGKPDRLVVPADPGLAVVGFAEHIQPVVAGSWIPEPGLVGGGQHAWPGVLPDPAAAHRVEGVSGEAIADLGEGRRRDRDLDVTVLAGLRAAEQIQRPARGHAPGGGDPGQVLCHLPRGPGE
jgi:hypothetical protein